MRFLVICRAIEPAPLGYPDQLELLEATRERFRNRTDPRVVEVLSFAGERSFALVVEAASARQLDHSVFGLPVEPLINFEVHVLMELEAEAAAG